MSDDGLAFDRLLVDALEHGGPHHAPTTTVPIVLLRTERQSQRRTWIPEFDRRTWPPRAGSLAHPTTWRTVRMAAALVVLTALVTTAAMIGARLMTPALILPYRGELTPVATLSTTFHAPKVVPLQGTSVLVVGSANAPDILAEVVDISTGVTHPIASIDAALMLDQAVRLDDGRVIAIGWRTTDVDGEAFGALVAIDPAALEASVIAGLPDARGGAALAVLPDGRLLVVGGGVGTEVPTTVGSVDIVDPRTGTVTPTGPLATPRAGATATALDDGRILIVGGSFYDPAMSGGVEGGVARAVLEVEVYEPRTGTFTVVGTLPNGLSGVEPVRLQDGRVLIPGVQDAQLCGRHGIDSVSSYLFDPSTDSVSAGPRLPHDVSSLTLLGDGTVLMTGSWTAMGPAPGGCIFRSGEYVLSPYVADAWIGVIDPLTGATRLSYDPFTGTAALIGDPSVHLFDGARLPDGRVVLATWDMTGTVDPQPPTQILVFE